MVKNIVKRDGRVVEFELSKIQQAIEKAIIATGEENLKKAQVVAKKVEKALNEKFGQTAPSIEEIQDQVEKALMECKLEKAAKAYIL